MTTKDEKSLETYQLIRISKKSAHYDDRHNHLGKIGPADIDKTSWKGPWCFVYFPTLNLHINRAIVKRVK